MPAQSNRVRPSRIAMKGRIEVVIASGPHFAPIFRARLASTATMPPKARIASPANSTMLA